MATKKPATKKRLTNLISGDVLPPVSPTELRMSVVTAFNNAVDLQSAMVQSIDVLNTAYSASMLLHYTLAFVFAALLARASGLTWLGSTLAALVYTYGWFPPRICLEWSITGGAWFPLALWCAERFLQTRLWRYPLWLTVVLAVICWYAFLAGHVVNNTRGFGL